MAVQYSKIFRGGISPISRDEIHIFRDPPKAIHTRKKERISDEQANWNVREDESRINEGIMNYARGINPAVEVDYSGRGAGGSKTLFLQTNATSNPYKINSAFRPPLFREEDLQPLSRLRRPYTYGITNPGVRPGFVDENLEGRLDRQPIESAISVTKVGDYYPAYVPPSVVYVMGTAKEVDPSFAIREGFSSAPLSSTVTSDFKTTPLPEKIESKGFISELGKRGFNASTNVKREGFKEHSLIDFDTKQNINDRTSFSTSSAIGMKDFVDRHENIEYSLDRNQELDRVATAPSKVLSTPIEDPDYKLERNTVPWRVDASLGDVNRMITTEDPEHFLERNTPLIGASAAPQRTTFLTTRDEPLHRLSLNQPSVSASTSVKGLSAKNEIDPKFQLERKSNLRGVSSSIVESFFRPTHQTELKKMEAKRGYRMESSTTPITRIGAPEERDTFDRRVNINRRGDRPYTDFSSRGGVRISQTDEHLFPLTGLRKKTGVAVRR